MILETKHSDSELLQTWESLDFKNKYYFVYKSSSSTDKNIVKAHTKTQQ